MKAIKVIEKNPVLVDVPEPRGEEQEFCARKAELIPSVGYKCKSPNRSFDEAGTILNEYPDISEALVTHRYPLDAVTEAFAAAADRAAGAIKVVFDIA